MLNLSINAINAEAGTSKLLITGREWRGPAAGNIDFKQRIIKYSNKTSEVLDKGAYGVVFKLGQNMEKTAIQDLGGSLPLPPSPKSITTGLKPELVDPVKCVMISRPGFGSIGRRMQLQANHFKVCVNSPQEICYQYSVRLSNLKCVLLALKGAETEEVQDALRVLDIILRQQAANRDCLLVRQSFFNDDSRMLTDVGGGVAGCCGLHSSFRSAHGGLSLNIDVTTMILNRGPVIDFLKVNRGARDVGVDWVKVSISYEDKKAIENERIGRKIIDKLFQTFFCVLGRKRFAYVKEKALYTVGPLPRNKHEFTVVLEESIARRFPGIHGMWEGSFAGSSSGNCPPKHMLCIMASSFAGSSSGNCPPKRMLCTMASDDACDPISRISPEAAVDSEYIFFINLYIA